ncbi:MAG TPA: CPBP family intramembrane glutamic endopeptidase [Polyangiaceae bacterium]|jgi:membrane protease YdiL (CAAX protease family)
MTATAEPLAESRPVAPSWHTRAFALALVALVLYANREPQWAFNDWVRRLAGHPAYAGPWLLVEHGLLSSTAVMAVSVPSWLYLAARGLVPSPRALLGPPSRRWIVWGIAGGLVPLAVNIAVMAVLAHRGSGLFGLSIGLSAPKGWLVLGNLISNFYEEFVFRGFLLVALRLALGSEVAAWIGTAAAHAAGHTQYPLEEQLMMGTFMVGWAWLVSRSKSIWTTYVSHEIVDLIGDSLVKLG